MESRFKIPISSIFLIALILLVSSVNADKEESKEFVVTLDHSNLTETISKHPFIVVEFYAPWCGHCKHLAPEYEQAASVLSTHEPPIVLAKFDASDEANKELASKYEIRGFPTLKIFRNGGENVQEYKGPREADGIVKYLKKQVGPASVEIKSVEEANNHITADAVFIVGHFPDFSGEEYQNFTILADKLRSDYDFGHTKDAKLLPRGDAVNEPIVRLFKPFDELVVDFQDFHVEALEKFIETASVPLVTLFNKDPSNQQYLMKFFNSANDKVMLFLNFSSDIFDSFKPAIHEVAEQYKGKGLSFLLGDVESSESAFDYFGLKHSQVPVIVIQKEDGSKYLKPNLEPGHIASWLKEYNDGAVSPFIKSEPIPEVNVEPVKVVVADSLDDVVFKSGKNVLLEFYAPWCGHCKKLAPILEEIALSFQSEEDVIIAKFDATANDVPTKSFEVRGYPTLYFIKATGDVVKYESGRTKDDIIEFIQKNRVKTVKDETVKEETTKDEL